MMVVVLSLVAMLAVMTVLMIVVKWYNIDVNGNGTDSVHSVIGKMVGDCTDAVAK